jgi:site-specific recombinase XerD
MNEIEQFQTYLVKLDKSEKTIRGYAADLRQFQKWLGLERPLASITPQDVRAYRDHMQTIGAKPNTISRHLASLASFGQWGSTQAKLFDENPAMYIEPVKIQMLAPRWLDREQKKKLLNAVDEDLRMAREKYPRLWLLRYRDTVIVHLLLASGLRVSELCDLELSDVTLSERKGSLLVRNGKGRKQRLVAVNLEMRKELADWLELRPKAKSDHLFIGQKGEPIHSRVVQRVMERYGEMAGLENLTPHTLRHTFARGLLDSGANPFEVAKLMGHSSLDSTMRYVQPSEDDLQNVVERLAQAG